MFYQKSPTFYQKETIILWKETLILDLHSVSINKNLNPTGVVDEIDHIIISIFNQSTDRRHLL